MTDRLAKSTTDPRHILLVEDDDQLADLLRQYLSQHGFIVSRASSGDEAVLKIKATNPDLVILDLMLPQMNGLDVCRQVRGDYPGAILMLTASQSEADRRASLELGANDFVQKPVEPQVLLARIRTQMRRLEPEPSPSSEALDGIMQVESLHLDCATRDASVHNTPVPLTTMEFDVLHILATHAGSVVSREDLYARVLGTPYDGIDRGMDVHVSRVRRKLERCGFDARRLKAVRGMGYLLAYR